MTAGTIVYSTQIATNIGTQASCLCGQRIFYPLFMTGSAPKAFGTGRTDCKSVFRTQLHAT